MLVVFMLLVLTACQSEEAEEYQYSDLDVPQVSSYLEGETMDGKYILYYYSETCPGCNAVKEEIIPFFMEFSLLDVYLLNTADMHDISVFTEFVGTPSLFIIDGSKTLYETYIGVDKVREFMDTYGEMDINLDMFAGTMIGTLEEFENKETTVYTILYDDETVFDERLLEMLFTYTTAEITLINVSTAEEGLISQYDYTVLPAMDIADETDLFIQGQGNIINYFEEN